jgi:choline dehydrogenase-like flavoprotein
VQPYFQRGETFEKGADTWRGGSGPLGTEFAKTRDVLYEAWIAAGEAAGYPFNPDYNGRTSVTAGARQPQTLSSNRRAVAKISPLW